MLTALLGRVKGRPRTRQQERPRQKVLGHGPEEPDATDPASHSVLGRQREKQDAPLREKRAMYRSRDNLRETCHPEAVPLGITELRLPSVRKIQERDDEARRTRQWREESLPGAE